MEKYKILFDLHVQVINAIPSISGSIQLIAGIFAMFYLGSKIWGVYAKNEALDLWVLLKPFVIGLICLNFTPIMSEVEEMMSPIIYFGENLVGKVEKTKKSDITQKRSTATTAANNALGAALSVYNSSSMNNKDYYKPSVIASHDFTESNKKGLYKTAKDAEKEALAAENAEEGKIEVSAGEKNGGESEGGYIVRQLMNGFIWIIEKICELIKEVSLLFIIASRCISLTLLYILGPLAFVLSIIPGWHTNYLAWLGKVFSIQLWLPIANIITATMVLVEYYFALGVNLDIASSGGEILLSFIAMALNVAGALCIFQIPEMAGWIVPNSGGDLFSRSMSGMSAFAGAMGGRLVGGAVAKTFSNKKS